MKRRYLTFTIRQLKAKLSDLSRTTFKITRNFFKSRLGIDKQDWSRLNKAEIIRVLNYYDAALKPDTSIVKAWLTSHHFQATSPENFASRLPKLPSDSGQRWRLIDQTRFGELSHSGIYLYTLHFQKVNPANDRLKILENPDCFIVVAGLAKQQLYVYVSDCYLNVKDLFKKIEQQYTQLRAL